MDESIPPTKFCVRCEEPILAWNDRYFRAILVGGQRLVEYFCAPCFKIWSPAAAKRLNA